MSKVAEANDLDLIDSDDLLDDEDYLDDGDLEGTDEDETVDTVATDEEDDEYGEGEADSEDDDYGFAEDLDTDTSKGRSRKRRRSNVVSKSDDSKLKKITKVHVEKIFEDLVSDESSIAAKDIELEAVRFKQGGITYFNTAVPIKLLQHINCFQSDDIAIEKKSQRDMNPSRCGKIASYVTERVTDDDNFYVFNSASMGIDASFADEEYESYSFTPNPAFDSGNVGILRIPSTEILTIFDGQHRTLGLITTYAHAPGLIVEDSLPVIFSEFNDLSKAQQTFSDLNGNAAPVNKSLTAYYDHSNEKTQIARETIAISEFLRDYIDKQNTTMRKNSNKLFSMTALATLTNNMFNKLQVDFDDEVKEKAQIVKEYFDVLTENIIPLRQIRDQEQLAYQVRHETVFASAAVIEGLGVFFNKLYFFYGENWLTNLKEYDFSKVSFKQTAKVWSDIIFSGERFIKNKRAVNGVANALISAVDPELMDAIEEKEAQERQAKIDAAKKKTSKVKDTVKVEKGQDPELETTEKPESAKKPARKVAGKAKNNGTTQKKKRTAARKR